MVFLYHKDSGAARVSIEGEQFNHIFRSRRTKKSEFLELRNLKDINSYKYKIVEIKRDSALLELDSIDSINSTDKKDFHIFMCVIDPKSIERVIPYLNEIGVSKISFVYCQRSQKGYKIDLERLEKMAILSSQQCGRWDKIEFDIYNNLDEVFDKNHDIAVLDFSGEARSDFSSIKSVLIGCEGGFTDDERAKFRDKKVIKLEGKYILKAESAATYIASKAL